RSRAVALRALAGPGDGSAGIVRQPGHRAVLHLFRVHADPAVLFDWDLGRKRTPSRGDHVFPVHAGGQSADFDWRYRAGGGSLPALARAHSNVLDSGIDERPLDVALARLERREFLVHESPGADLPALVCRVRDQGPDLSVPHMASPGARRGTRGGLDPAGG